MRILTEPDASLCRQYAALLATEGVTVEFAAAGVRRLAEIAFAVNSATENIGARRLHTVLEKLLETVSYEAPDRSGWTPPTSMPHSARWRSTRISVATYFRTACRRLPAMAALRSRQ